MKRRVDRTGCSPTNDRDSPTPQMLAAPVAPKDCQREAALAWATFLRAGHSASTPFHGEWCGIVLEDAILCGIGLLEAGPLGRCPSLADSVTVRGPAEGAPAAGGC